MAVLQGQIVKHGLRPIDSESVSTRRARCKRGNPRAWKKGDGDQGEVIVPSSRICLVIEWRSNLRDPHPHDARLRYH